MHPDTLVPIRQYIRPVDAHIDRALLQDAGFEAHVANEHTATVAPHFMLASASVELQVRSADIDSARQLLLDQDTQSAAEPEIAPICPDCGSSEMVRKRPFMFAAFLFVLLQPLPGIKRKWACRACGKVSTLPG